MSNIKLPRRAFLQGAGAVLSLPFFESLLPLSSKAFAQMVASSPTRLLVLYKPNGEYQGSWNMNGNTFPFVLEPLQAVRSDVTVLLGLRNRASEPYSDGHAPRLSCFLTGGPVNASTSNVSNSKSIDQIIGAARKITPLTLAGPNDHPTDNGFNGEYFSNLSWVGPRAAAKIKSPRAVFDMLFPAGGMPPPTNPQAAETLRKKSVLDYAKNEATRMMASMGQSDRAKLDEYLTSVREIEVKLEDHEVNVQQCIADTGRPSDNNNFEAHTDLMLNLMVKAIQCNHTQVATYMMDCEVGRGYRNHHSVSHYTESSSHPQTYREINRWYISQVTKLIQKMKAVQEVDGTLLDNSMVIYGGGLGDGNGHSTRDLCLLVAGKLQGKLTPGRVLTKSGQPLANLMLTALQKMGVNQSSLGSTSTGVFSDL